MRYTLLLQSKQTVDAYGETPMEACQHYANQHPGETVTAWRDYHGPGETIRAIPIEATPKRGPGS